MKQSRLYFLLLIIILPVLCLVHTGCQKEYSFEGADTTSIKDSIPVIPVAIKEFQCSLCIENNNISLNSWNFKTGNSYLCGTTDNAGFLGTNDTFTFFGPSACSADTGLVMSVYLPVEMNEDMFNVTASHVAFYYYDHGSPDLFVSRSGVNFTLKVKSYFKATRIATGSFEGTVFRANGDSAQIREGNFMVFLK